jgi:hypothetical protein
MNPEDLTLAYNVLLGTGDVQAALQIAQAAVRQLPASRDWRVRLARVAEWTQQPQLAAQQWAALFAQGARDTETLNQLTRLAWQMEDLKVPIAAWNLLAQRRALSRTECLEVFKLYEEAAMPAEGSRFFEARFREKADLTFLEYAARLASNYGNDERTLELQVLRSQAEPFSLPAVLDVVMVYIRSNRLPQALTFMQQHASRVPDDAVDFWRLLGEVAWDLQRTDVARSAYSTYVKSTEAGNEDWLRLVSLMRDKEPAQAAQLSVEAYRRFGMINLLVQALEIYANAAQWSRMGEALALLQGQPLREAENSSQFLLLRARYAQGLNKPDDAWSDLRRAMGLEPRSKTVALSVLWFLIDQQRLTELEPVLRHYAANGSDADFWPAFAAAHQVLNQPRRALYWYQRSVRRAPQDVFVLLNYADSLERNQQPGMSARVRRHAWLALKEQFPTADAQQKADSSTEWRTLLRLSLLNRPGDPALRQVRAWAHALRTLPADASPAETTELVLAWAISREQSGNARAWMARHYRQHALAPVWARAQVALQTGDTTEMAALLQTAPAALPIYNRYDIERAMALHERATHTAFEGLEKNPNDEALYDRLRQHAPAQAAYVETGFTNERTANLDRNQTGVTLQWPLHPEWTARATWSSARLDAREGNLQTLTDPTTSPGVSQLSLHWTGAGQSASAGLTQRKTLGTRTGLELQHAYTTGFGLQLIHKLGLRASSTVSPALQVAGAEDVWSLGLDFKLDKRTNIQITPALKRFTSVFDDALGRGQTLDIDVGYRLRMDYPDWRLRANLRRQVLEREGPLQAGALSQFPDAFQTAVLNGSVNTESYFLPESSTSSALCLGMGENLGGQSLQNGFSRRWRPFGDVCLRYDSQAGDGFSSQLGIAGSLLGNDLMRIELEHSNGLVNSTGPNRTLTLRYRNYF